MPPSSALLTLRVEVAEEPLPQNWSEEWRQEEDGNEIVCGHAGEHPVFIFCHHGRMIGLLTTSADYRTGRLVMPRYAKQAVDNAMMITFALATACADTLLFHASVVSCHGKAYMFLGPSGTGKSTHSQLWIKHIEGSRLINDDNPVVRLQDDGRVMVYGSPWSGKTPCYLQMCHCMAEAGTTQPHLTPASHRRLCCPAVEHIRQALGQAGGRWPAS